MRIHLRTYKNVSSLCIYMVQVQVCTVDVGAATHQRLLTRFALGHEAGLLACQNGS